MAGSSVSCALGAATLALIFGCGHDWDALDPRLAGSGGASASGPGGSGPGPGPGGAAGAGGAPSSSSTSSSSGGQAGDFGYRRTIDFEQGPPLAVGHTVVIAFNHSTMVTAGKALQDGSDVRVYRAVGSAYEELPRVVDLTFGWQSSVSAVWFRLPEPSPGGGVPPSQYYLYYGNPNALPETTPPSQVFLVWDDFEDGALDPAWTASQVGAAFGWTYSEANGVLHIQGAGGAYGSVPDSIAFIHRAMSGDFVADAAFRTVTPGGTGFCVLGGVSVRQSNAADAPHVDMVRESAVDTYVYVTRATMGASNAATTVASSATVRQVAVRRVGTNLAGLYPAPNDTYTPAGPAVTIAFTDPVLVGIPFADNGVPLSSVDIEWFRAVSAPVPNTTLGPEEQGPFAP